MKLNQVRILVCFDAVSESGLNAELIDAQVEQLMEFSGKNGCLLRRLGNLF